MSQWIQSRVNSGNESDADGFTPPPNSPESVPAPRELFDGGPDMIQLLTPSGERIRNKATAAYDAYADALTDEELRSFYRDLVLIRRMDNEANALQRQGELGIWVPLLGQEAAQIGVGRALRPQDYAFPTYREHGVAWCRGIQPEQLISLFRGVDHGNWIPDEHNFHLYAIVIGAQALHAVGYAMGVQRDGATATPRPTPRSPLSSVTAPPARAMSTSRSSSPRSTTRRSSSSARTTSSRSPSPTTSSSRSRSTSARTALASPACGSMATTSLPHMP